MRLLVAIALVFGCSKRETPLVLAVDPVSEADAKAFGEKFAALARPCDSKKLAAVVDQDAMAAKFATTSKLPNVQHSAHQLLGTDVGARILCGWMRGVSDYKPMRVKPVGSEFHPILRRLIKDPRSGITVIGYDELQLGTTRKDHQVRLYDAFSYVQGQWLTQVLGGNMAALETSLDTLGDIPQMADQVKTARELVRAARFQESLQMIDKLPPEIRNYRSVQLLRIRASAGLGKDSYRQALAELEKLAPNDPSIAMVEMDGAFAIGDYDAALRWIDVIDKEVGGDPFQEANRAFAYFKKGDMDKAAEHIDAAMQREPTLQRVWEVKLDVAIMQKKWADAATAMTTLESKFGAKFDEAKLRASPAMAEFVETPEFKQWLANRK